MWLKMRAFDLFSNTVILLLKWIRKILSRILSCTIFIEPYLHYSLRVDPIKDIFINSHKSKIVDCLPGMNQRTFNGRWFRR